MSDTVRVTVTISLDVDREAWDMEYREGSAPAEVRRQAKTYIEGEIRSAYPATMLIWSNITVK